ncbi:putative Filamentous hemagglutinin N-terminal domain-containing protein [Gammaproteobacteria bacterium]
MEFSRYTKKQKYYNVILYTFVLFLSFLYSICAAADIAATTLPTGGVVSSSPGGSVTIDSVGAVMNVTQVCDKAIVNWKTFNVGTDATVNFNQPSPSSVILNRVQSTDPSQILGTINSNGKVVLINPSGFIFASGSQVNVGSLIASTMGTSDNDFLSGKYVFSRNNSNGSILNEGTLTAADGGMIALLAPTVKNEGVIVANMGSVVMAAGEKITFDFNGDNLINLTVEPSKVNALVENKKLIKAQGGQVYMLASAAAGVVGDVVHTSTISANRIEKKGGKIYLRASAEVNLSGTIDASGGTTTIESDKNIVVSNKLNLSGDVTAKAKDTINIKADVINTTGSVSLSAPNVIGNNYIIDSATAISLMANMMMDITILAPTVEIYKNLNLRIESSSVENNNVTIKGNNLSVTYLKNSKATIKTDDILETDLNVILTASKLALAANKFGSFAAPIVVKVDDALTIQKITGDINIAQVTNTGTSIMIRGPPDNSLGSITYNKDANLLLYTPSGNVIIGDGVSISSAALTSSGNLIISSGASFKINNNAVVNIGGSVINSGGILDASGNNVVINVGGDWDFGSGGVFIPGTSSTVFFIDASQISNITGGNSFSFHNLTCTTPGKTIIFDANSLTTINNLFTVSGSADSYVTLISSVKNTNNNFNIYINAVSNGRGDAYLEYLNVSYSTAYGPVIPIQTMHDYVPAELTTDWDATFTWVGGGANNWSTGANWSGGMAPPSSGADLVFPTVAPGFLSTNNDFTNYTFKSITISGSGYTLAGNSIKIGADDITDSSSSGGNTISLPIALTKNLSIVVTNAAETLTISGAISGAHTLTKEGSGVVTLSGINTYTRNTTVSAGILNAQNASALGTGAGTVSVTSGAALQIQGGITITKALTLNGTGISDAGALDSVSGANVWSGAITLGSAARINSDTSGTALTLTGGITGAGYALTIGGTGNTTVSTAAITGAGTTLTKDGAGTLLLSFANTYGGATAVTAGTLSFSSAGNLGTATSAIALSGAGILSYTGPSTTFSRAITVGSGNGEVDNSGTGTLALSGGVTGSSNITMGGTSSSGITISSNPITITGSGSRVIVTNPGMFTSSVVITAPGGFSTTGAATLSNNIVTTNTALGIGGNLVIGSAASVILTSGSGTITISGNTDGTTAGTENLTVNAVGGRVTFAGAVGSSNALATLTMTNSAALNFHNAVTITGAITQTNAATGMTTFFGAVTAGSATFRGTTINLGGTFSVGNGLTVAVGTLVQNASNINISGGFTIGSGAVFTKDMMGIATITLSGASQGISDNNASSSDIGLVLTSGTGTVTMESNIKLTSLSIGANTTFSTSSYILTITGIGTPLVWAIGGMFNAATGSTVNYANGVQTVANVPYYNLTVSGGGIKIITSGASISNNGTITGGAQVRLTPVATGVDRAYDGDVDATVSFSSTVNIFRPWYPDAYTYTAMFDDKDVGIGKTVDVTGIASSGTYASDYVLSSSMASTTATINPLTLTIGGGFTANDKTYNGNSVATINTNTLTLLTPIGGDDVSLGAVATFSDKTAASGKTVSLTGSTLTGADKDNYSLSFTGAPTTTATINPLTLTIGGGFTANDKTYNGNNVATINTSTLTLQTKIGSDDVSLSAVATFLDKTAAINKLVSLTGSTLTGTDKDNYSLSFAGAPTTTATINPLTLTIGGGFTANDKTYNGNSVATINTNTLTLLTPIGGDDVSLGAVATFSDKTAASGKTVSLTSSTLTGGDASNYLLSFTGAPTTTATINPLSLTIGGNFTASDKPYDGTNAATISVNNLTLQTKIGSDDVSLGAVATFSDKNIADNKVVSLTSSALIGADKDNYSLSFIGAPTTTANIAPIGTPLTISGSFTVNDKLYDGNDTATISTGSFTLHTPIIGDDVSLSAVATFSDKNVASGKTVSLINSFLIGKDAPNYSLSFTGAPTTTATINPLTLTIGGNFTANDKAYNGNNTATISVNNLTLLTPIGGDSVNLNAIATFSDKTAASGKTVSLTSSTLTGGDASNYLLSFTGAPTTTATINPLSLTIGGNFTASDKPYDGTNAATISVNNLTLQTKIGSDDVSLGAVATFSDKNIADNKVVSLTSSALIGADKDNYSLSFIGAPTTTANIAPIGTPLTISGSFTVNDKLYDGNDTATISTGSFTLHTPIIGDDVSLSAVATFSDKNVASGKTVSLINSFLIGKDAPNYSLSFTGAPTTTATINPLTLTIGGNFTANDKAYNGNNTATISVNNLTLLTPIGGDSVNLNAIATFSDKTAASGKTVSLTGSTLTGADKDNYSLSFTGAPTTTATINPLTLTIGGNFTANNKPYDGTNAATISANNLTLQTPISGDSVNLNAIATFSDKNVANNKVVSLTSSTLTGGDASNYSLSFTGAPTTTANITTGTILTIDGSFTANDKPYDGNSAATINASSLTLHTPIIGDDVSLSAVATFSDKNVASGKTVSLINSFLIGGDAYKYSLSFVGAPTTTTNITPAPLTITANDATIKAGEAIPALTVAYAGFVGGDTSGVVSGLLESTNATINSPAGTYTIYLSGGIAENYTVNLIPGKLTILPAIPAIKIDSGGILDNITGTLLPIIPGLAPPVPDLKTGVHNLRLSRHRAYRNTAIIVTKMVLLPSLVVIPNSSKITVASHGKRSGGEGEVDIQDS